MLRPLARVPTFRSVVNRNWRTLWMAGHLWHLAFWMDLIVLGWLVLELTDSPLLVALVGTFRLIPMGLLGSIAGSLGDRLPKKRLLIGAQCVNLTVTFGFTIVLLLGEERVWLVYAAALLTGSAWSVDFPVRRAFIRDLLPGRVIVNAMAIDAASLLGSVMIGRWTAGVVLALSGPAAAYAFMTVLYVIGMVMLLRVPDPNAGKPIAGPSVNVVVAVAQDLGAGLAFVWRTPVLRAVLLVTLAINLLVAPYLQLTPVFAREVYGVGPAWLGLLSGMDGLGALTASMILASAAGLRRLGLVFAGGALLISIMIVLFSQAPTHWWAIPLLAVGGLGIGAFATMQTTLSVIYATPEMRSRAMGAVALGIGMMPIGMAFVGALAEAYGAPMALGMTASVGFVIILAIGVFQPALRRARSGV